MNCLYYRMALACLAVAAATGESAAQSKPRGFHGDFVFRWLDSPGKRHRNMEVLSGVSFVDAAGKEWSVPAGAVIDGASIPSWLWSFAGSPFVGNYRRASVIHDHLCDTVTTGSDPLHRVFLDAMLFDGLDEDEAQGKFTAVRLWSFIGGECGEAKAAMELQGQKFSNRLGNPDELADFFSRKDVFLEFNLPGMETAKQRMETVAEVAHPRTFDAMVELAREPGEEKQAALQSAIAAENPGVDQLEALSTLAAATAQLEN